MLSLVLNNDSDNGSIERSYGPIAWDRGRIKCAESLIV